MEMRMPPYFSASLRKQSSVMSAGLWRRVFQLSSACLHPLITNSFTLVLFYSLSNRLLLLAKLQLRRQKLFCFQDKTPLKTFMQSQLNAIAKLSFSVNKLNILLFSPKTRPKDSAPLKVLLSQNFLCPTQILKPKPLKRYAKLSRQLSLLLLAAFIPSECL